MNRKKENKIYIPCFFPFSDIREVMVLLMELSVKHQFIYILENRIKVKIYMYIIPVCNSFINSQTHRIHSHFISL